MSVSKKGKRKILVDNVEYYWYVMDSIDAIELGTDKVLCVLSDCKKFIVHYPINQTGAKNNLLIVLGKKFGGIGQWGNCWQMVVSPRWECKNKITPKSVENLIRWSLDEKDIDLVDYRGNKI
jgi:hypothetical protein